MIVEERVGNLFDYEGPVIGHGVNCRGYMGAGIAKEFHRRWPDMFSDYQLRCLQGGLNPGDVHAWQDEDILILNLATQDNPGPNARLGWIRSSVTKAAVVTPKILAGVQEFAIPRLGCGIGGLQWDEVRDVLGNSLPAFDETDDFTVIVYSLEGD